MATNLILQIKLLSLRPTYTESVNWAAKAAQFTRYSPFSWWAHASAMNTQQERSFSVHSLELLAWNMKRI